MPIFALGNGALCSLGLRKPLGHSTFQTCILDSLLWCLRVFFLCAYFFWVSVSITCACASELRWKCIKKGFIQWASAARLLRTFTRIMGRRLQTSPFSFRLSSSVYSLSRIRLHHSEKMSIFATALLQLAVGGYHVPCGVFVGEVIVTHLTPPLSV